MGIRYKIKGHETFTIREGWLSKGIQAVEKDSRVFYGNSGADELGVGTNMAKSIRYWMKAAGLAETKKDGDYLTELGKLIYEKDRYMEDRVTLWIIHCNIVRNKELATSWYLFFHADSLKEFTREALFVEMKRMLKEYTGKDDLSERSVNDDCNALLHMYENKEWQNEDPEEKRKSPFAELGLLKQEGKCYKKSPPRVREVSHVVFWYLLSDMFCEDGGISIQAIMEGMGSPGKILNLGRIETNYFLDILEEKDIVTVNRTAGLDMVYPCIKAGSVEILKRYYGTAGGENGNTDYAG